MDKAKIEQHKKTLLLLKAKILNGAVLRSAEDLVVKTEDLSDETDLATSVVNQQVSFNIRNRELEKLRMIENALYRIEEGSFGHCEECEETIAEKRLSNQPWATLCITHAEEREREGQKFVRVG